jgi:ABC-2 type transport system ATP-binding protein
MKDLVIRVENLIKSYDEKIVIRSVSFCVYAGEIFGLLGPNGAGKTTTIEILEGFRKPDEGLVEVFGQPPSALSNIHKARIGVQLQESYFEGVLTVRELLERHRVYYPQALSVEQVAHWVGGLWLDGRLNYLSWGQRKRVALALALLPQPELLFLDEPSAGLDPASRRLLWQRLKSLKASGKTIFLTTNQVEEAEVLCDRVGILHEGCLVALDSPRRLIERSGLAARIEIYDLNEDDARTLEAVPGVAALQHSSDGVVFIQTHDPQVLLKTIVERGFRVRQLRQPTLEDVFLTITANKEQREGEHNARLVC